MMHGYYCVDYLTPQYQDDNERTKMRQQKTLKVSVQFGVWYAHCPVCGSGFRTLDDARSHCVGTDILEIRRKRNNYRRQVEYRAKQKAAGIKRKA